LRFGVVSDFEFRYSDFRTHDLSRQGRMKTATLLKDGAILIPRVEMATRWWQRMRGLLGRPGLAPGDAIYLAPAPSIHTFFMRFTIDLVFVTRDLRVVRIVRGLPPFRLVSGGLKAHGVFELESGWLPEDAVAVGERLEWGDRMACDRQ